MVPRYLRIFVLSLSLLFLHSTGSLADTFDSGGDKEYTGNFNIFLGGKALQKEDWEPVEEHGEFGLQFDYRGQNWPVNLAIDLLGSGAEEELLLSGIGNVKLKGSTSEFNVGVRKIWDHFDYIRPFIGGGLAFINGKLEAVVGGTKVSDSGSGTGLWLDLGVFFTFGSFNIGLELKSSSAQAKIFDTDTPIGGGHSGIIVGYHF